MLAGHIRTQAGRCEDAHALEEARGMVLRAGEDDPTGAVTAYAVRLGQAVEGEAQQIRRQRGDVDVLGVVVEDLVVDLVGEDQQRVFTRQFDELLQDFA